MQGLDADARRKAPRSQAERKSPKLESECKAGAPQSKGQAEELLQLAQRVVQMSCWGAATFASVYRQQTEDL